MSTIALKKVVAAVCSATGLLAALERQRLRRKAFILMYHRVIDADDPQRRTLQPGMYVTSRTFEKQVAYLRKGFRVVFLEELVAKVLAGEDTGGHCAITFDDGWYDNKAVAFPILKRHSVPATIFLATGFIGTERMFWPDEMMQLLQKGCLAEPADGVSAVVTRFCEAIGRDGCEDSEKAVEVLKGYTPEERNEVLAHFRRRVRLDSLPRQMLTWDEAREMCASGLIRFGAHTVNHELLDKVSLTEAEEEIRLSRRDIEKNLGVCAGTFAYPNGNHNGSIRELIRKSGCNAAVTTCKGFLHRSSPVFEIPRIGIHEDVTATIPLFRSRILCGRF